MRRKRKRLWLAVTVISVQNSSRLISFPKKEVEGACRSFVDGNARSALEGVQIKNSVEKSVEGRSLMVIRRK